MANSGRVLDSFTIADMIVRVDDCVMMRPSNSSKPSYIRKVKRIRVTGKSHTVDVQWFYRPEDVQGGRRPFHGMREIFLSDHFDTLSSQTIDGKCHVHSLKRYTKLPVVKPEDFYCRFTYDAKSGTFLPDSVEVYCKYEMPYNPDQVMVQCERCEDWFHPACVEMTQDQATRMDHFYCPDCAVQTAPVPRHVGGRDFQFPS